ncbi:MAG: hypothetical protein ACREGR_00170, partial [Minisyncoccia bacterium]
TLNIEARTDLEMHLLDHNAENHFIHYQHGLPPVFSKGMFRYEPPACLALGDLFHTLLSHNPTTSTNVLQKVVRSYISEHKIEVKEPVYKEIEVIAVATQGQKEENAPAQGASADSAEEAPVEGE